METILQLSRRHNSPPSPMDMKYSPTESLKLSSRDNKRIERRKPNWTEAENVFLLDQFGLHREILTCKATDASTNLKKQEIWRLICQNLNTHNTLVRRTPAEVRRKWKNLVTAAKKEVWEMRHQIHLSGGASGGGANGRKISELSQRVLQLHSSGGFSSGNPNGLYGTLLSAGLIGPPSSLLDKYGEKSSYEDKSYIPAHFTPIITLSESNNNHISYSGHSGDGPPSPLSDDQDDDQDDDSSDSRNATEFMSDSGIYEQEGIDLRVNVNSRPSNGTAPPPSNGGGRNSNGNNSDSVSMNGGRHLNHITRQLLKNHQSSQLLQSGDEDDDVDCEDVEDMSLIRFMGNKFHKGSINPLSTYISTALYNNANNNGGTTINGRNVSTFNLAKQLHQLRQNQLHSDADSAEDHPPPSQKKNSDSHNSDGGEEVATTALNKELIEATLKLKNHFLTTLKDSDHLTNLYRERLELQIDVLKLRKQKLTKDLHTNKRKINGFVTPTAAINRINNKITKGGSRRRKNNSSVANYFRLKPKNTWINFAAKEKLIEKGTNTEKPIGNGITVNGNAESGDENDN